MEQGGLRLGVVAPGAGDTGARLKAEFQSAIDRGAHAVVLLPRGADAEGLAPRLIEPIARGSADLVTLGASRAVSTAFLSRVPFWENTDDGHFDAQLQLQAAQAGAAVVELSPSIPYGGALERFGARLRFRLHRRGILYSRNYDLAVGGRKYFDKFHDPASSHSRIWAWLTAHGVDGKQVLELGVGDASLTKRLAAGGAVVDGIELDAAAAEQARGHCRAVTVNDLDEFDFRQLAGRYDLVVAADVLEHLRSPERVLADLRQVIRPGGRLVVSLPNVANLYVRLNVVAGRFPYHTKGILDRTHLHFFTLRSADRLFRRAGWRVLDRDVTVIPLVVVFPFLAAPMFRPLLAGVSGVTRLWKSLLAYQGLFVAEVDSDR